MLLSHMNMDFLVLSLTKGFQCLASTCLTVPSFTSKLYVAWQYLLERQSLGILNQVGRLTRQGLRGSIMVLLSALMPRLHVGHLPR